MYLLLLQIFHACACMATPYQKLPSHEMCKSANILAMVIGAQFNSCQYFRLYYSTWIINVLNFMACTSNENYLTLIRVNSQYGSFDR